MAFGWLGTFVVAFWAAVIRIRASGAVPSEEFAPAVTVYRALPILLGIGIALLGMAAWRRRSPLAWAGLLCVAVSPLVPLGLAVGTVLLLIVDPREGGPSETVPRPDARRVAAIAVRLCGLATLATLLLGLAESFLYVPRFVPRLVSADQVSDYRLAVPGLSVHFGVQLGLIVTAALLLVGGRKVRAVQRLGLLLGFGLVAILGITVRDEVRQIGFALHVLVAGASLGGLAFEAVWPRLENKPAADTFALAGNFFRYGLIPPVRFRAPLTFAAVLAVFLGLGVVLYPEMEDFRAEIFDSYATLAALLAMLLVFLVAPRRHMTTASLVLLAAAFAVSLTASGTSRVRIVAHEYSRFGALAANSFLERRLDRTFSYIGRGPVEGVAFPFHAPGDDRLSTGVTVSGKPLVVILIWDGARPDRCSAYGYERDTTPHLKKLAEESLLFTRAYSNATATTCAVRMLMSGRYATRYMLATDYEPFFTKEFAEVGYERFAVTVTGTDFNGVSGEAFERGWDAPSESFTRMTVDHGDEEKPDGAKTRAVLEYLRGLDDVSGTFVYLHLTGSHYPWFDTHYGTSASDRYDSEMRRCDALLGDLLGFLEGKEYILVMTADHGTGLGEHGRLAGFYPYEEQIRVPLLLKFPGVKPGRIDDVAVHIDIAPTLLSLFRPGQPHRFHGRSLLGEKRAPRPFVSFNAFRDCYAIFDGDTRWKLHHDRTRRYESLFDMPKDPAELDNRIMAEPQVRRRLRDLLAAFLWEGRNSYGNPYHYRDWK